MSDEETPALHSFGDVFHRALFDASGRIEDKRRIVQFLYILLRDELEAGVLGGVLLGTFAPKEGADEIWAEQQYRERPEDFFDPLRLVPYPTLRHTLFVVLLCREGCLRDDGEPSYTLPRAVTETLGKIPGADDVGALFSNGWTARYCQAVADWLQNGLPK